MSGEAFSVAITCAHSSECLTSTLHALGEIVYPPGFEVIVIDDGRRDGREDAALGARRSGLKMRYLNLPGITKPAAWNVAICEAKGESIAFLEDGCIPSRDWLTVYEYAFDEWTAGVAGGPDRSLKNAGVWERSLDYVLNSFIGTLGVRSGHPFLGRYYPRPWNMAARRQALRLAGGFNESAPESPEVTMISRLIRLAFKPVFAPNAVVSRRRETGILAFAERGFRLGAERGRGIAPPGLGKVYAAIVVFLALLGVAAIRTGGVFSSPLVLAACGGYALMLGVTGVHAAFRARTPVAIVTAPPLMFAHHASHIAGYIFGLALRLIRRPRSSGGTQE